MHHARRSIAASLVTKMQKKPRGPACVVGSALAAVVIRSGTRRTVDYIHGLMDSSDRYGVYILFLSCHARHTHHQLPP
jgi:hypothetical protein